MEFDSTFWVAISFVIFFGVLIYFKIPRKINEALNTKISEIKNACSRAETFKNMNLLKNVHSRAENV